MIRNPLRPSLLLVALFAVVLPASAAARVRFPDPDKSSDDVPAIDLAGERLVATQSFPAGSTPLRDPRPVGVFAAPVSGAGKWLLLHRETFRMKPDEGIIDFEVRASADRLALFRQSFDDSGADPDLSLSGVRASLRAGPLSGPLTSLTSLLRCPGELPTPAVDGPLVAYVAASCSPAQITVRDPQRPASSARSFAVGGDVSVVAVAGRYVAALVGDEREGEEKGKIVLLDHSTGRTVLRIAAPAAQDVAVQADGTVAFSSGTEDTGCRLFRVEWFSPTQPKPRPLAERACDSPIQIAADRIAYRAGDDGVDDERIVLAGLDGSPAHTVARTVQSKTFPLRIFDWDGARVAYREERCVDSATVVAGPDEPTETFGPLECPIDVLSGPGRLARDNSVEIRVRCANGCDGEVGFTAPRYLRDPFGGGVRFRVAPGKARTVRVPLSRRQAARLRSDGSAQASAVASSPYAREEQDLVLRARR